MHLTTINAETPDNYRGEPGPEVLKLVLYLYLQEGCLSFELGPSHISLHNRRTFHQSEHIRPKSQHC